MLNKQGLMQLAIEQSQKCPKMEGNFSVGCVICNSIGDILTSGYTGERGGREHAEEIAITKANEQDIELTGSHLFCTLEPCGERSSSPTPCAQLITDHKISHVYYLHDEPSDYVDTPVGRKKLLEAGVVVEKMNLA